MFQAEILRTGVALTSEGTGKLTHPKYRPDIDGLRAVAVLAVVLYHAFPETLHGGFTGVDIFFVISGYLISTILIENLDRGTFSYATFYARRIRRIFPALLLVLMATCAIGWVVLVPYDYRELGKHLIGASGFVSNFVLWQESGYFDTAAELKPLLHLWSLGIEEQFYILWPPLLVFAWKRRLNVLHLVLGALALSFLLNVYFVVGRPSGTFYLPLTRMWELLVGGLLAYRALHPELVLLPQAWASRRIPAVSGDFMATVGVLLIADGFLMLDKYLPFPDWRALIPTVGACLIIAAGKTSWLNRIVLSNRVLVWVGLISFPLYLWHWPLLVFTGLANAVEPSDRLSGIAVVASVVLAWLTYALVERPVRHGTAGKTPVLLLIGMFVMGLVGFSIRQTEGFASRFSGGSASYNYPQILQKEQSIDGTLFLKTCFLTGDEMAGGFPAECVEQGRGPLVVLWGDSHAQLLYPGMKALQATRGFRIAQFAGSVCPPLLGADDPKRIHCRPSNDAVLERIRSIAPDTVVLHANWTFSLPVSANTRYDLTRLDDTVAALRKRGVRNIVVLGAPPQWAYALPARLFNIWRKDEMHRWPPLRLKTGREDGNVALETRLRKTAQRLGVQYISIFDVFCNAEGCLTRTGETSLDVSSYDGSHLSIAAAQYLVSQVSSQLLVGSTGGPMH